ncbi:class I SAM-dependent methyltransferase [bacterium]|nr:class I SAM-dependent methyltransferase [bacterium]
MARNVLAVCWRQWRAERALDRRGVHFRSTVPAAVAAAYAAMSAAEFEAINGPQAWANWRTIPRAVRGRLPDRPCRVIDLGCGTGTSTQVLAYATPPGSLIVGYEQSAQLLAHTGRREYVHRGGHPANIRFVCQGVTEPFRGPDGGRLANGSVDLVSASGVVGHHLNTGTIRPLVGELRRVVIPGGLALLDYGPTLPAAALVSLLGAAGFLPLGHYRSWPLARSGQVAFRRPG